VPAPDQVFYEQIDHTADLGIRVFGANPEELFANAARALVDLHTDWTAVEEMVILHVEARGQDWEQLLHNWLRELHFVYETERLLLPNVAVIELDQEHILAECSGEAFNGRRHEARGEIKAVTHHGLEIWETEEGGLEAEVIFDL